MARETIRRDSPVSTIRRDSELQTRTDTFGER